MLAVILHDEPLVSGVSDAWLKQTLQFPPPSLVVIAILPPSPKTLNCDVESVVHVPSKAFHLWIKG